MKLWSIMAHCRENPCKGGVSVVVAAFFCGEVRSAFNDYTRNSYVFIDLPICLNPDKVHQSQPLSSDLRSSRTNPMPMSCTLAGKFMHFRHGKKRDVFGNPMSNQGSKIANYPQSAVRRASPGVEGK